MALLLLVLASAAATWAMAALPASAQSTVTYQSYWLVASDGGVFTLGGVAFFGSMGGHPLNAPIVGMAATPDGQGYWEVASDGGIFSFGDAQFFGSMGGHPLNRPIVGMAATPDGAGYWEVASDGGIFAFGDAQFRGSTGLLHLNAPVVAMAQGPGRPGFFGPGAFPSGATGYDISWPQCYPLSIPPPAAVAVVGANGGTPETPNPCLAAEWRWAAGSFGDLYMNINWNGAADTTSAYDFGYQSALWAVSYA
ncbi:MAG TPA: hypothetical protein VKY15_05265, partial [Acidimicrobiales bacterium]|nr:hypothetical protein [Acidimicrobiales bacterium]